jgi:hypothetical protein
MPCFHKFKTYLNLNKGYINEDGNTLDFVPNTLIVGTFNPAWPVTNPAQWYYGRTKNNYFWDVLPRLYQQESLINSTPVLWRGFCHAYGIAITDLIVCINDAHEEDEVDLKLLRGYSDKAISKNFMQFNFTNVVNILERYPTITNVYFTRGIGETFWKRLWRPINDYCEVRNKRCKTLLTPSGYAFYQHSKWNKNNPEVQIARLEDFIFRKWQDEWHPLNGN